MKEHRDACQKGVLEKSVLADHAWENYHPIKWEETTVVDHARIPKELLLKEAIHTRLLKPPSQQGWGTGAAWMLDGYPEGQGSRGDLPLMVTRFDTTFGGSK